MSSLGRRVGPPEPSRFIMMHEPAAYPWFNNGTVEFNLWHSAANPGKNFTATSINTALDKLVAPVLFVDGHGQQCNFTAIMKKNPYPVRARF
jgi:hypothetical protein